MSYEDEYATDHLHVAQEMLGLIDNLHGDELDQAADLERGASAHALVDVAQSLRRLNEGRDQWYREVLGVLTQAKEPAGSPVGSGQPAAAPDGQEGGEPQ